MLITATLGEIYCLNANDGIVLWKRNAKDFYNIQNVIEDGRAKLILHSFKNIDGEYLGVVYSKYSIDERSKNGQVFIDNELFVIGWENGDVVYQDYLGSSFNQSKIYFNKTGLKVIKDKEVYYYEK